MPTLIGKKSPNILVVDNGGSKTRMALGGGREIGPIETYATPQKYDKAVGALAARGQLVLDGKKPDAIGISVAGELDKARKKIVSAGELEENGWAGQQFLEDVAQEMGVAPDRIVLLNDAEAGGESERRTRPMGPGDVGGFLTLSTGLGGALYTKDQVITDAPGHYYLKPGAICGDGQEGHIEAHIGGAGIYKKYGSRGEHIPHKTPAGRRVWEEIKQDFHDSMEQTFTRWGDEMQTRVSLVGFTGSVALGGPNMLGDLQVSMVERMGDAAPYIAEAVHGEQSGLYGAMFAAQDRAVQV